MTAGQLSNAARWVMAYLATYCGPGKHALRDVGVGGIEWCTRCYKEQRHDGRSCLVCDQPGEIEVELQWRERTDSVRGRLCRECRDGLNDVASQLPLRSLASTR
jgi:hypothetical protein